MNFTLTYKSGTGAGNGYTRVGHNSSIQNPDSVWSFTLTSSVASLSFDLSWNNTKAGTGWSGNYTYAFAISNDGASGKQLAKGSTNVAKVTKALSGSSGTTSIDFTVALAPGTYYLRANLNGTTLSTMKAFSKIAKGSSSDVGSTGFGGVPARKIYVEKQIKKDSNDNTVDRLIMVGYNGSMLYSTNGTSWSSITTGSSADLYGIDFVGAKYIACGTGGTVLVSSNMGSSWTSTVLSADGSGTSSNAFEGAEYANGLWLVAGGNEVWVSNDASTWELTLSGVFDKNLEGVLWDGSKFIAYGDYGKNYVSNDGYSWDAVPMPEEYPTHCFIKMIKAEGYIYAVLLESDGIVMRSADGYTWEKVLEVSSHGITSIAYGDGMLVAVGELGSISYSKDGVDWTSIIWGQYTYWDCIAYGFGKFVIGGTSTGNTPYRAYSSDGINWTGFTSMTNSPADITFGLSQYHYDIRQACYEELIKRQIIDKVEGEVENNLPPRYGIDYNLGDIVQVNAAGWQGRQRITKVRHVLEPNRVSITPVIGDDFLDLRQFIKREVNK